MGASRAGRTILSNNLRAAVRRPVCDCARICAHPLWMAGRIGARRFFSRVGIGSVRRPHALRHQLRAACGRSLRRVP